MAFREYSILVVDDEPAHCDVLATILTAKGYSVSKTTKPLEALAMLETENYDLVLADLMMPELDGIGLLQIVRKKYIHTTVIIMTAYGTIENAVNAMKLGAYTYIIKGSKPEDLLAEIRNLEKLKTFNEEKGSDPPVEGLQNYMLETESEVYRETLEISKKAARSDANILILGESGSGKEVLAQLIHQESKRRTAPFMDVNCFSLTETLIESELFGHEKGSFTGATNTRVGRFEAAEGGTLFLDEIGDIPLVTQAKLLKAIENKKIMRIGRNDPISIDFRLISATNKDLQHEIQTGMFREDLFYRLSTIIIEVPPLRSRREDLEKLIQYFIHRSETVMAIKIHEIEPAVLEFLHQYEYPGNIRELKNMIERLVVLSEDGIIKKSGLMRTKEIGTIEAEEALFQGDRPLRDIRSEFEAKYISMLLKKNNHNVSKTAEILGISRRQLFNKITEYGLK